MQIKIAKNAKLFIQIAFNRLFLCPLQRLVRDLDIIELAEQRELRIDGAENKKPHPLPLS